MVEENGARQEHCHENAKLAVYRLEKNPWTVDGLIEDEAQLTTFFLALSRLDVTKEYLINVVSHLGPEIAMTGVVLRLSESRSIIVRKGIAALKKLGRVAWFLFFFLLDSGALRHNSNIFFLLFLKRDHRHCNEQKSGPNVLKSCKDDAEKQIRGAG